MITRIAWVFIVATLALASGCQSPRPSVSARMEYRAKPTLADSGELVAGINAEWH
jgi:hypothetical protein